MEALKRLLAAGMIRRSLKGGDLPLGELETKHSEPATLFFNDSTYFMGQGEDGSCLLARMAFRTDREPECWLTLYLEGTGTFTIKGLPGEPGSGFSLGDLHFNCEQPGRRWTIRYSGDLEKENKKCTVDLDLVFESITPLVNFKYISRPEDIAPVIAREKWSKTFLNSLKEIRKMHLEQAGRMTGTITIDGRVSKVEWRSVRDHSWGIRNWGTWKRHVWLSGILDNGEAFNLSMISYSFLDQLSAGYITQGEQVDYLSGLPAMDSFAADPLIPKESKIAFHSRNGRKHILEIEIPRYFGFMMDGIYYIHEGMGKFILDGIPGFGVAEFGLNTRIYDSRTG